MKKRIWLSGAAVAALGYAGGAYAQERQDGVCYVSGVDIEAGDAPICYSGRVIIVPGSRAGNTALEDFTGSASIITDEHIRQRQVRNIEDALRDVPGVAVSSVAGQTQIRLRGTEANHVLVLVDGIEVSDPFAGEFDVGTLQAEIGSRVEVLRGPQSALYGSDAIGGVVAYESGRFDGFAARLGGGTNSTVNGSARVGTIDDTYEASLSATVVSTDGEPNARNGTRDIGRDSYTISGRGSAELADGFVLRAAVRFVRTEGEFNDQDFTPISATFGLVVDSPGTRFENEAIYGLFGAKLDTLNGRWTQDLSIQIADIERDSFNAFGRSSGSEGDRIKASYVSAIQLADDHSLTLAADWERERFRNNDPFGIASSARQEIENVGVISEYRYSGDRFDFSAAIRHDINDRFADETTFRVGAGFDATESTRLRASIGSGIKNPGFFELFGFFDGRFIGNEDLQPEKSSSWEIGVDQSFASGNVTVSATYFDSTLENEIFTDFPPPTFVATPANRNSDSTQRGVELSFSAALGEHFSLNAAYAFLDAEEDGVAEVRRPESIASAALSWTAPDDRASATLVVRHNGEAEDLAFTDPSFIPARVVLDDHTLVNFNAEMRLNDQFRVFGRVENLFDETYEQVFSFVSPGRTAVVGIGASF